MTAGKEREERGKMSTSQQSMTQIKSERELSQSKDEVRATAVNLRGSLGLPVSCYHEMLAVAVDGSFYTKNVR